MELFPIRVQEWTPALFDFAVENSRFQINGVWVCKNLDGKYQFMHKDGRIEVYADFLKLTKKYPYSNFKTKRKS